ncbi:hypothetical protein [uncultured Cytophaga sp.]|nr:hypothetical protein [uncultured Cytophaga sp.]
MKKIIALCTIVFTLIAFSASAAISSQGHKYKKPKAKHHRSHTDPSYSN